MNVDAAAAAVEVGPPPVPPVGIHAQRYGALVDLFSSFLDDVRQATSMVDVNLAAGIALQALLGLAEHAPDQLGQVINLPL